MEFIDLKVQQEKIRDVLDRNIHRVLDHGHFIMGPEIKELEEKLGDYVGSAHAISCASGADALLLSLMALGVGPGHAVFTTPFTFVATAEVISLLGATPIFVDIDPKTFSLDPRELEKAIIALPSRNSCMYRYRFKAPLVPKCIITVDLFGLPADYESIEAIAQRYAVSVVEDGAQAFGAQYRGKKACSFGRIGCTSFFPAKPLGCYGDGGMCFTNEESLASILRCLRVHGQGKHKYENVRIGINSRLDTLQAAILLAKFDIFSEETALREEAARRYAQLLGAIPTLEVQTVPPYCRSIWAQYCVLVKEAKNRPGVLKTLEAEGIPTAIYYPKPLHLQQAFAPLGYQPGDFPVSEDISSRIFSLPMHPYLRAQDQERIAELLSKA
jgi:dTDP-4-amino-4,6-dideoxygalactose transaminase